MIDTIAKTRVAFRVFDTGEVIALFPGVIWANNQIASYMHVGQHGGASRILIADLRKAKKAEYMPLYNELENIGYNLQVMRGIK